MNAQEGPVVLLQGQLGPESWQDLEVKGKWSPLSQDNDRWQLLPHQSLFLRASTEVMEAGMRAL